MMLNLISWLRTRRSASFVLFALSLALVATVYQGMVIYHEQEEIAQAAEDRESISVAARERTDKEESKTPFYLVTDEPLSSRSSTFLSDIADPSRESDSIYGAFALIPVQGLEPSLGTITGIAFDANNVLLGGMQSFDPTFKMGMNDPAMDHLTGFTRMTVYQDFAQPGMTPIPEPSSLALGLSGAGLLACLIRRRSRR